MTEYGLIGHPIGHSFSPGYFAAKFERLGIDASYTAYDLESIDELPDFLAKHPDLRGFNVTIPYKQAIIPYLASITREAEEIGAVNTVFVDNDGKLHGHNTDYEGFKHAVKPYYHGGKALVLGTGGASKAVCKAIADLGGTAQLVSRTSRPDILSYEDLTAETINAAEMIVNTTPLGTWPNTEASAPLPYNLLTARHFCIDLVYNPAVTQFMQKCAAQGCAVKNGLDMLHGQAEAAWLFWTNNQQPITNNQQPTTNNQ